MGDVHCGARFHQPKGFQTSPICHHQTISSSSEPRAEGFVMRPNDPHVAVTWHRCVLVYEPSWNELVGEIMHIARATLLLSSRLLRPRSSFPSLAPLSRWRTTDAIPTQMTNKTPDLMKRRILPYILLKHWLFEKSQTSFCPHRCVSHLFGVYVY